MTQSTNAVHSVPPEPGEAVPGRSQPAAANSPRTRRAVTTVAVALVLMIGAGAVGGWAATEWNDTNSGTTQTAPIEPGSSAGVVKAVEPSVVSITTGTGEGSGVVFDSDGHIVTNNHVVASASGDTVNVTFNDGTSHKAEIVGTDPRSDIAVVKVNGVSNLKPATFGNSDDVHVGETVLAMGSPLGLENTVTSGIISAKNRTIHESDQQGTAGAAVTSIAGLLQTDAAINPGNSGGALVNESGDVIGINTAIATAGGTNGNIGVGFAIPSDTAKHVAKQLISGQKVSHPYLGVAVAQADDTGALIQTVEQSSPAARAGLQAGDLLTKVGDHTIHSADDLVAAIQGASVGQHVKVTYTRGGDQHTVTVTIGDAP